MIFQDAFSQNNTSEISQDCQKNLVEFAKYTKEKNYEKALIHELKLRGLNTKTQETVRVNYKGVDLDCPLRFDVLVEDLIIVENKSVIEMHPIFDATVLSYMKHLKKPKGILLNFNVTNLYHQGRKTFVNEYFSALSDF